jgi:biotin synthase
MIYIEQLKEKAVTEKNITVEEAMEIVRLGKENLFALLAAASEIREHYKGSKISLCAIVNAKSGRCAENCRFCAQSAHYQTDALEYPLISSEEIIRRGREAWQEGAHLFGIVTSGTEIRDKGEWEEIYRAVGGLNTVGIKPCGSLGMLSPEAARGLRDAGLYRYHHNLETSRSFFDHICSTHDYEEDIETVKIAKEAGLSVCSGGIIGLGETIEQRIELAFTLKDLDVDSVPINILNPIPGTPLVGTLQLTPIEILITLGAFRFILPDKDIKLCGGKERNLRQLLPLGIAAGVNSLMTGNYLTTTGRNTELDLEMIRDLGLETGFEEGLSNTQ